MQRHNGKSRSSSIVEGGIDWVIADKYPGNFGTGLWHQTGTLHGPDQISQNGTGGYYLFGSQRLWGNHPVRSSALEAVTESGSKQLIGSQSPFQKASLSGFFQYGINNAETLPMNQSFGFGLTAFGWVPTRPSDSLGAGMSWAWTNPKLFHRSSELMFQGYYQAFLMEGLFFQPTVSLIPTPGADSSLGGAWALTFRLALLF